MSVFFPDSYVDSLFEVDFTALYNEGYRGVIFDVDNTLVPHGAHGDERAIAFFKYLRDIGFVTLLLSNNGEPRVKSFKEEVGATGYIYKAGKPKRSGYEKAMEMLGTDRDTTLFCGDQIFTDIWGANISGIRTIMTKPVLKWREEPQIILKRFAEAIVLFAYKIKVTFTGEKYPAPIKKDSSG